MKSRGRSLGNLSGCTANPDASVTRKDTPAALNVRSVLDIADDGPSDKLEPNAPNAVWRWRNFTGR